MPQQPYTRDEIEAAGNSKPDRGVFCHRCKTHIPAFAELSPQEAADLRRLPGIESIKALRDKTGCSLVWAKIWLQHPNGPHDAKPARVPCPYCLLPLNPGAKQCPLCKMDWHNPDEIVQRGESLVDVILNADEGSLIGVNSRFSYEAATEYAALMRPNARLIFSIRTSSPD